MCKQTAPLFCGQPQSIKQASIQQTGIRQAMYWYDTTFINTHKSNSLQALNMSHYSNSQRGFASWILLLFIVAMIVTAGVALFFGQKLGYQRGYHASKVEIVSAEDGQELSVEQIQALRLQNDILNNDVATTKQELAISLANLDELRQADKELKVTNRQLEQVNSVYGKFISDNGGMPLQILGAKIEPLPENAFEYRFDIAMLSDDGREKTLIPTLTLLDNNSLVEVPLEPRRYRIDGISRIRGRFMMPDGFKPLQVKLELNADGQKVEQLYNWRLGKSINNMPMSLAELPDVDNNPVESD